MSRVYNQTTIAILQYLADKDKAGVLELKAACAPKITDKDFYNYLFRLHQQELIKRTAGAAGITADGQKLLARLNPSRDGVWKLVIFDIAEKDNYVRTVLRAKLKQLHFKKWQNSIWISPFALEPEIEAEFKELGKKYFIRLIKTTDINHTADLERMFK